MNDEDKTTQEEQAWGRLYDCLTLQTIDLCKPLYKIGRATACDAVLDRQKVSENMWGSISKIHFTVAKKEDKFYLKDLSKNGTFLNGQRVKKGMDTVLNSEDSISIDQKILNMFIFRSLLTQDLPDTLTPKTLSNSPGVVQRVVSPCWGRLISCMLYLESVDLHNLEFKIGRANQCDVVVERLEISSDMKKKFSKEHFVITMDSNSSITYVTDLSKTGTYVNGVYIGKNKTVILQNEDTIAVGPRRTKLYIFKSMSSQDCTYLPTELRKKYEISTVLGKGACGEVRLAYNKYTCKKYAIKKILKGRSTTSQLHQLNHPLKIETEIQILRNLSHPCVINMKEIIKTQDEVFIVLDFMKGGELSNLILSNVCLTESNVKFLFYQMVLAVQYLHSKGITHRDLKPENVLLSTNDIETLIKVSDFGLSKEGDDNMQTICGTLYYIAPEVLDSRTPEYDKQVDVWSLGVILFYMFCQRLPFKSLDKGLLCKLIISGVYSMEDAAWSGISMVAKDLLKRMLTVNPKKRITINNILKHSWIAKDIALQYNIDLLLKNEMKESGKDSCGIEPLPKRIKLDKSEESTV